MMVDVKRANQIVRTLKHRPHRDRDLLARWLMTMLFAMAIARGGQADDSSATDLLIRAREAATSEAHQKAKQLLDKAIAQANCPTDAYYWRARSLFCLGQVKEAVTDFDHFVKHNKASESRQWERGIAMYYAGQYQRGADQFKLYQTYHDNDVENSVWRFLCVARAKDLKTARKNLLPIRNDRRIPMMKIYDLYRGQATPDDVLNAAEEGSDSTRLAGQRFYAQLYVGLYYEATGKPEAAAPLLKAAAENHRTTRTVNRYMWSVADVHYRQLLTAAKAPSKKPFNAEAAAKQFVADHERTIRPLELKSNLAWWQANTTGKDADFAAKVEAQNALDKALGDAQPFARLKRLKSEEISDPILRRQIDLLFLMYQEKQVDQAILQRMTSKANAIEKQFNFFRANVNGDEKTDSQVRKILASSKDSALRRATWEASKRVGAAVEQDLKELVLLRNDAAHSLEYKDFHDMSLSLHEQSQTEVLTLFDELDELTREPFLTIKGDIDRRLAAMYGISIAALRPWHYHDPFFQEPPNVYDTDLDAVFAKTDILRVCRDFYSGIGLPINDVLERSDLYEKPGKSPHAFCTDIDREGDVRVLANIVPNEYWITTMMHELGHAVYSSKFIPRKVPYVLRSDAHILTTEGVAMMFERFPSDASWLRAMAVTVDDPAAFDETARRMRRNKLLIFSRWCQVMFRFEMAMYQDPSQDLSRLWWDLVEKYQGLRRPEGRDAADYASKIHVVSTPAYYHNYMMGELFACQLHEAIVREVLHRDDPGRATYQDNPRVGAFLREKVFGPGRTLHWNEMTRRATGKKLSATAFANEFRRDAQRDAAE